MLPHFFLVGITPCTSISNTQSFFEPLHMPDFFVELPKASRIPKPRATVTGDYPGHGHGHREASTD